MHFYICQCLLCFQRIPYMFYWNPFPVWLATLVDTIQFVLKLRDAKDHQGTIPAAIKFTLLSHSMLPSLHNHITLIHCCVADTGPVGFSTVVLDLKDAKDHQGTIPAAIKFTVLSHYVAITAQSCHSYTQLGCGHGSGRILTLCAGPKEG